MNHTGPYKKDYNDAAELQHNPGGCLLPVV